MQAVRQEMLADMVQHDCLVILAKGMGMFDLCYQFLSLYSRKDALVFIINMPKHIQSRLELELRQDGCEVSPRSITTEFAPEERSEEYAAGGCVAITSRILAVDLLTRRAPIPSMSGILVWDAHKVSEISSEAFILRLFRQENKHGFIKGISDSPDSFGGGFFKVEKVKPPTCLAVNFRICSALNGHALQVMKSIFVPKLFLWPRFHIKVNAALSSHEVRVAQNEIHFAAPSRAAQCPVAARWILWN
jgi:DNA excision repair protein ERCC-4